MRLKRGLALIFALTLVLAACGDDDDSTVEAPGAEDSEDTEETGDTGSGPDYGDRGSDGTSAPAGDGATVAVASHDELGEYLVDAEGRTLYLFTQDDGTTTACTGGCVDAWPPLIADGEPTGGEGIDAAQLGTADGIEPNQVTYNGHLLYYFSGDEAPGDTNGTSVPDWFAVSPSGDAIEAS